MLVDLYHHPASAAEASLCARWCRLHVSDSKPNLTAGHALWLDHAGFVLLSAAYRTPFQLLPAMLEARGQGRSLLAKACGAAPSRPTVFDPFAGFGLDGLLLARMGCAVTMVERHPLVWLLLRAFAADLGLEVESVCADGQQWLRDEARTWDVVYLDPIFPPRRKRALPNRGLQHLQDLSADFVVDVEACLALARARARQRVVLKRRLKDPIVATPTHQIRGQAVRFDVYL